MQFKHPEILWALFLLIIPILIHLFQLRRFKKTPFTNVAMLQKVVSESRKSNSLKKWLLLFTRLLLLVALILAFAQPFSSSVTALQEKETVIYLDDSFSMQAKNNGFSLLERAVQDLIKNSEQEQVFSLFTNEKTFANVTIKDIQNSLLALPFSPKQLNLNEIGLKANTLFSKSSATIKNLIVISDFQQRILDSNSELDSTLNVHLVPMQPQDIGNVSIDSIYFEDNSSEQASLKVLLSGGNEEDNLPISLYNNEVLIAKSAAKFSSYGNAEVLFTVPNNQELNGRLFISESGLSFDNTFYFNINTPEKVKVVAISNSDGDYLNRLFQGEEFEFQKFTLNQFNYSELDEQNVVVLNDLTSIPTSLQNVLNSFKNNGGTVIIVPAADSDINNYNVLLSSLGGTRFTEKIVQPSNITQIAFDHPLYTNVFEREVTNFQYPTIQSHFRLQSRLPNILSLQGGEPFLVGLDGVYVFSTSLDLENSNFINSPLIVPTFYNMSQSGSKSPQLYQTLGEPSSIDITTETSGDDILKVAKEGYEFIPLQQNFPNRVRLSFDQLPTEDGIYSVMQNEQVLKKISFNYLRWESELKYLSINELPKTSTQDSVAKLFDYLKADSNITAYWKWFVILALLLALVEVIIQKFVT
ncbi:BatA domain-containing protein [Flagellimonas zhangzhouensis]|uniref:N-terminal double-transmembrane domain-containing protein n=1 Tax=Flagellimonas zhangzhouensis TaxID=1073328 RepID=A0A1H2STA3_9FLAO|nr:BatA domain-containing protein [Allomuricauda zhangzhouensis]SDQ78358.1 N-terminal double-transmembrane domain-containing protein [Allomuricauda zhangzhouensis]SDW34254.1 N-terminal double-transmembrane domain-containing protein [Allomuricauda zhangzhouensis]